MWRLHICRRLYWEIYLPIQSPSKKLFKAGSPLPPCVHGSGVSWEEWQGSSRVVLLQDIQEPLGHLQCSAGRSEDDGASRVKWVRFLCYCLVFLVLWSFIFDIGYLRIFAIVQKSEEPTTICFTWISFLAAPCSKIKPSLIRIPLWMTGLKVGTSEWRNSFPWPTENDSLESVGLWEHFLVLTLTMSNNQLRDLNMLF